MTIEELLPRLPDGVGIEIVERKIIEHGAVRVVSSIDLAVGGHPSMRFSTVADVSAALDLVAALAQPATRTVTTAPTPPRPRATVVKQAVETAPPAVEPAPANPADAIDDETDAWLSETDDVVPTEDEHLDEQQPEGEPAAVLSTPSFDAAPAVPAQSRFANHQQQQRGNGARSGVGGGGGKRTADPSRIVTPPPFRPGSV